MPSDELFVDIDAAFSRVEELRRSYRGVAVADGLVPVEMPSVAATETLTTAVGLAAAVQASIANQLELIARSMTLGALRIIAADDIDEVE